MVKLPIYELKINDESEGLMCLSIVDEPAVESYFQAFGKKEQVMFQFADEEQRNVLGVIMRADFPIYRYDEQMGEYYITYSKETIKQMLAKMLKDETYKNISLMHNGELIGGVTLLEIFIKDDAKGISPKGFENISDGSLFATYHIENEDLWKEIKNGTFRGFSLEGWFTPVKVQNNKQNKQNLTMFEKIKNTLRSLLQEFASIETNEGVVIYYDGELATGIEVVDETGNPVADGDYTFEDKVFVIKEGKIAEIKVIEKEPEESESVELEEEIVEPVQTVSVEEFEALKKEFDILRAEFDEIKKQLEKPVQTPVVEEFKKMSYHSNNSLIEGLKMIQK